jgi:DNA polymerase III subunit alpha
MYGFENLTAMFVHIRCKTEFSILNGTITIANLKKLCTDEKMPAIAMIDDYSMSGALEFSSKIKDAKSKPLIGLNMAFVDNDRWLSDNDQKLPHIGFLAMSDVGYRNLLKMLYRADFAGQKSQNEETYITAKDLDVLDLTDVICISGGYLGGLARYFLANDIAAGEILCEKLKEKFGDRFYIELTRHGRDREMEVEDFHIGLAMKMNIPLVATNDPHFVKKEGFDAYDVLTCIGSGRYVQEKNRIRLNSEYYLKSSQEMIEMFSDIPEAIENTVNIAKRCNFYLTENKPMLPTFCSGDENLELRNQATSGLNKRLDDLGIEDEDKKKIYFDRLDFELAVIEKMGFAGYFLIVSDFIVWAKLQDIPVGPGRGSGAGSIIAWACQITNLDPIHYGLLFERFLNPERVSMPDFDIDFCQSRRGEVIEYVKQKYGVNRVASIITFGKLQAKAVLKDVGRVLQMSYGHVDSVCKMIPFSPIEQITIEKAIQMDQNLQQEIEEDPDVQNLVRIGMELEGLNRHTSTHAAGIIIGAVDLLDIVPIKRDENSEIPVLAFNMKDAEKMGLLKFDFLGLKTLTVIHQACKLAKEADNLIDIDRIKIDDAKTFKLLQSSKLKGVFQLEAAIPRQTLENIKTDRIEDLIAITSLNRPGPMEFIPDYVRRKTGQEVVSYPHDLLKIVLAETFGIIIYQEQVMEVAKVLAGYTLGGADLLRRAMGKKIKAEMDQQREIFVDGAKKSHNIEASVASEVFDLVEKFAGYGFNKSHAAAYSLISYQTAYLKANATIEFFVANLNLELANTDKLNEFVTDARQNFGINIILPNINISGGLFGISRDRKSIIYGLGALKSVGLNSAMEIAEIRNRDGKFTDVFDFAKRVGHKICNKKQLESLILTGCFDDLHKNRKQLFDSVEDIVKFAVNAEKSDDNSMSLFGDDDNVKIIAPELKKKSDYKEIEKLRNEMEYVGFYLSSHPLLQFPNILKSNSVTKTSELEGLRDKKSTITLIGVVTKIIQRFKKGGRFCFLSIADLDGIIEIAFFNSDVIIENKELFEEGRLVCVEVSAIRDESGLRLIGNGIKNLEDEESRLVLIDFDAKNKSFGDKKDDAKASDHYRKFVELDTPKSIVRVEPIVVKKPEIKPKEENIIVKNIEEKKDIVAEILPDTKVDCVSEVDDNLENITIEVDSIISLKSLKKLLLSVKNNSGISVAIKLHGMKIALSGRYDVKKLNLLKK